MTTALKRPTRLAGKPTRASQTLDRILTDDGPMAKTIRRAFLRDQLWRFRSGSRRPELESMFQLRDLTGGKIAIEMWTQAARS
jgi:hypothetical protein